METIPANPRRVLGLFLIIFEIIGMIVVGVAVTFLPVLSIIFWPIIALGAIGITIGLWLILSKKS